MACMFNKGENCIAAGRLFVEASIHDEFVHRVVSLSRMIGSVWLHYWGAQVQVLPEIKQVGCGLNLFLVQLSSVPRGYRGTVLWFTPQVKTNTLESMFYNTCLDN